MANRKYEKYWIPKEISRRNWCTNKKLLGHDIGIDTSKKYIWVEIYIKKLSFFSVLAITL